MNVLKGSKAKHILLVIDSCFAGAFGEKRLQLNDSQKTEQREILEKKNQLKSRWVMAANGLEPVLDAAKGDHSIFTLYFLKALRNVDTPVTAEQLFYSSIKESIELNSDQSPSYTQLKNVDSNGGDFIFVKP